jgi:hypothetical protein
VLPFLEDSAERVKQRLAEEPLLGQDSRQSRKCVLSVFGHDVIMGVASAALDVDLRLNFYPSIIWPPLNIFCFSDFIVKISNSTSLQSWSILVSKFRVSNLFEKSDFDVKVSTVKLVCPSAS